MITQAELIELPLEPGGLAFVNGTPIRLSAEGKILIPKDAETLTRDQLIPDVAEADTASKKIYFALQLLLLDPANAATYERDLTTLIDDRAEATTAQTVIYSLAIISELVRAGDYIRALKICRHLIEFDAAVLAEFPQKEKAPAA
jgi:flagellar protein FlbT